MNNFSFLRNKLPRIVSLSSGKEIEMDTRACRALSCIDRLCDTRLSESDKIGYVLDRILGDVAYSLTIDERTEALGQIFDFLTRSSVCTGKESGNRKADFDFTQDSGLIVAGFLQTYGLDIEKTQSLHWWVFCELLQALPEGTAFSEVRRIRSLDIPKKGDASQIARLRKMKRDFALVDRRTDEQKRADLQKQIDALDL